MPLRSRHSSALSKNIIDLEHASTLAHSTQILSSYLKMTNRLPFANFRHCRVSPDHGAYESIYGKKLLERLIIIQDARSLLVEISLIQNGLSSEIESTLFWYIADRDVQNLKNYNDEDFDEGCHLFRAEVSKLESQFAEIILNKVRVLSRCPLSSLKFLQQILQLVNSNSVKRKEDFSELIVQIIRKIKEMLTPWKKKLTVELQLALSKLLCWVINICVELNKWLR